jgi:acyl carrier protein
MSVLSPAEYELAALIIEAVNLEMQVEEIEPDGPLFGEGLGLDSIDMLEISLAIQKKYAVQLRSDDPDNSTAFSSLRALTQHVQTKIV